MAAKVKGKVRDSVRSVLHKSGCYIAVAAKTRVGGNIAVAGYRSSKITTEFWQLLIVGTELISIT